MNTSNICKNKGHVIDYASEHTKITGFKVYTKDHWQEKKFRSQEQWWSVDY